VSRGRSASLRRTLARSAILAGLALASSASMAQVAVTLYGGARGGGNLVNQTAGDTKITLASGAAGSLSVDWLLDDGRQAEVFYSFQRSALPGSSLNQASDVPLDVHYLHVGGRVFLDGTYASNSGYAVGGLGITHFKPDLGGLSSETRASMNLGLGYQWMLARQIALRTELRGYLTLINSSGGFFCSGGCTVSIRGDTLTQVEGMVGLSFGL
jgi:hypothetical protein